jgi:hypothetical protein
LIHWHQIKISKRYRHQIGVNSENLPDTIIFSISKMRQLSLPQHTVPVLTEAMRLMKIGLPLTKLN